MTSCSFEDVLDSLLDTSLVRRDPKTSKIHIHRLIQFEYARHLRQNSAKCSAKECFLAAARLLYDAFPKQITGGSLRNEGEQCKKYIQHVLFLCAQWREHNFEPDYEGQFTHFTKLLTNAGWSVLTLLLFLGAVLHIIQAPTGNWCLERGN